MDRAIAPSIAGGSIKPEPRPPEEVRDKLTEAEINRRKAERFSKLSNKMKKTAIDGEKRVKGRQAAKLAAERTTTRVGV
jgi:hypothetical protein